MKLNLLTSLRQLAQHRCAAPANPAAGSLIVVLATFLWLALSGHSAFAAVNDGLERWREGSIDGAPTRRDASSAVWTGREMIVWGGHDATAVATGGRYDPLANIWSALPTNGAPSARYYHAAIWTGSEMIIWGGGKDGSVVFNTGARYNPLFNAWTPISINGAPSPRDEMYDAVWSGSEMLVWGGWDGANPLSTGGRYNPATDTWTQISTNGAPTPRYAHAAVWTGTEMIIWGGFGASSTLNTGARYNPASNTWTPITTSNAPAARFIHATVWTGREMIVWGGRETAPPSSSVNTGGRYNPASDSWTEVTTYGAPSARADYPLRAVWTGREMIAWGGHSPDGSPLDTGGLYDPVLNSWRPVTTANAPSPRLNMGIVWTGEAMIIFGGTDFATYLGSTYLYFPSHACEPAPQGLVAWWPGDGNANDIVGTSHGVLGSGAGFAPSLNGQGFSFNGVAGYVSVPHSPSLRPGTNSFSLAAWIKTTNAIGWRTIIAQYEGSGSSFGSGFYLGSVVNGKLRFDLRDSDRGGDPDPDVNGGQKLLGTHDVADGAFHYVAFVRDVPRGEMRIYLDGTLEASAALNAGATGTIQDDDGEDDPVIIGAYRDTYLSTVSGIFDGVIDEVQYYAGALTSNEITAIYAAGSAGLCRPNVPSCSNCPPTIVTEPVSRTIFVGGSASFVAAASGTGPLSYKWLKEGVAIPGATSASYQIVNAQTNDTGHYSVLVTNLYGSAMSSNAMLTVLAQSPPPDSFNPGADNFVSCLAVQADGKILVGGEFRTLGGQSRIGIGRLNADGTLDTSFNPGADILVSCLAVQADGKILVGGYIRLYRLNPDGTLDASFKPGGQVFSLALQADGKILAGGEGRMFRLNADGTLDASFNPGVGGTDCPEVDSLALQADGKILVGGYFTTLGGQSRTNIGRLHADGTLDSSFNPGSGGTIYSLVVQADGKILVGGYFTTLGGQSRTNIGRLNADGALDASFNPGANGYVGSVAVQADGQILVGGAFTTLGGQKRIGIGRLNADGTLDLSFNPGASSSVFSVAVQADGKILVGGLFGTLGGQSRNNIGRLNNTAPATQSLTFDGSTVIWSRGGTSPEVWRTTFEYSPDGASRTNRAGIRISGGWQLTGLALPTNTTIRARGYTVGGRGNGSGWFVETSVGSPLIYAQPASLTNNAGTTAVFSIYAGGGSLSYQWRKDGANLADGGSVSGAATPSLTLSNVLSRDAGSYSVVINGAYGSATSLVAVLTVIDPVINGQPASQVRNAGDSLALSVVAAGTTPLSYQWRQDGVARSGATQSSLTLTNLLDTDAGSYDVVVSNVWGSVTSAVALLSVNLALPDSFNPGADNGVSSLAVQTDGKILVGGVFTTLGGQSRSYIGRLNPDGTLDADFNPGADSFVDSLAVQADGKILVGGYFTTLAGQSCNTIGRLNPDGTLDSAFNPGAGGAVYSLAVQDDGKIVVGGQFTMLGGQPRSNIGRLEADGTLDTNFNPGANQVVESLALQPDGKILVGGSFTTLGGQSRMFLGRLNADGTLDENFDPSANAPVYALAEQADGKILIAGYFTMLGGQSRNRIGRLSADGTLDTNFNPAADDAVFSLAVQVDGKILVVGAFTTLGGQSRINIGRLNADGALDRSFDPGVSSRASSLAVQADGKILVGGDFPTLAGQSRRGIGRLNNTGPATQRLTFDGSKVSWQRGGTSPEVWRTTFDYSSNGVTWTSLGPGSRITGGWRVSGLALPPGATIRARGYVTAGGVYPGAGWFVESLLPTIAILDHDGSFGVISNQFGFNIRGVGSPMVLVEGSSNLVQWIPLYTSTLSDGSLHFSDPGWFERPVRFYRARLLP